MHTCTAGLDYITPSAQFRLNPGDTSNCIQLTIVNDNIFEPVEDLIGRLTSITLGGQTFISLPRLRLQPAQTTISILDNDGTCTYATTVFPSYVTMMVRMLPQYFLAM